MDTCLGTRSIANRSVGGTMRLSVNTGVTACTRTVPGFGVSFGL